MLRLALGSPFRSAAIAVSEYAGEISTVHRDKWRVVPDAVSAGPRRPDNDCGQPPSIGAVVNQRATKGLDILANVIAGCDDLGLKWSVFGSAVDRDANHFVRHQRDRIDKSARSSIVDFRGVVPDLKLELQALDALVLTSRRESFSRVAAESMLAGVPLVAPLAPGLTDTIAGGEFAATYSVGDHAAACEALRSVLANYRLSLRKATRARTFAAQRFAPEDVCDDVIAAYKELL
jgi:glycosyltransferase involved in cell wall biosynthesis